MAKHLFYCINADSNNCSMQTFVFTSQNLEQNRYCLNILIIVGANYYKSLLYTVQKCIKSTKNPAKKKKSSGKNSVLSYQTVSKTKYAKCYHYFLGK